MTVIPRNGRFGVMSAFRVPAHLIGDPPPMRTRRERGVALRAQCRHMGLDFDEWPEEAQDVEMAEWRERLDRESQPMVFSSFSWWDCLMGWLGR